MAIYDLKARLSKVSHLAGVYYWINQYQEIIYVGKATNLNQRMQSYLTKIHNYKMSKMLAEICDFRYTITESPADALLLEQTLIKRELPTYNILFKDDKSYPYVVITNEALPRLLIKRRINERDYFIGPFPDGAKIRQIVNIIERFYPLRKCQINAKVPCFYSHLHQCINTLCKHPQDNDFPTNIKAIKNFFQKNSQNVINKITELMNQAAEQLDYETAHKYKVLLMTINNFINSSVVVFNDLKNRDAISYYLKDNIINITTFQYQAGKLLTHRNFMAVIKISLSATLMEFINYFYSNNLLPQEIITNNQQLADILGQYLITRGQSLNKIIVAKKGLKKTITDSLLTNSQNYYELNISNFKIKEEFNIKIKAQLLELLHASHLSEIAFFDNSHYHGQHNLGVVIINKDFQYLKSKYRYYKIGSSLGDDCKTFKEVIYRFLYRRLVEKQLLPDLLVIDGGLAQYQVGVSVVASLGLTNKILLVSLVKDDKHETRGIIIDGVERAIAEPLYSFMAQIQTEGDRYAKAKMHNQRSLALFKNSPLDKIPGLGKVSKAKLLAQFKTLYYIKKASLEQLSKVVSLKVAQKIKSDL